MRNEDDSEDIIANELLAKGYDMAKSSAQGSQHKRELADCFLHDFHKGVTATGD